MNSTLYFLHWRTRYETSHGLVVDASPFWQMEIVRAAEDASDASEATCNAFGVIADVPRSESLPSITIDCMGTDIVKAPALAHLILFAVPSAWKRTAFNPRINKDTPSPTLTSSCSTVFLYLVIDEALHAFSAGLLDGGSNSSRALAASRCCHRRRRARR